MAGEKVPNWECLWPTQKRGGKRNDLEVRQINETSGSRGTNTSVRSSILGMYAARLQAKLEDRAREQRLARILDLSRYYQTFFRLGEIPPTRTLSLGPLARKDVRRNVWKDVANWQKKKIEPLYAVLITVERLIINATKKNWKTVGALFKVCSKIASTHRQT